MTATITAAHRPGQTGRLNLLRGLANEASGPAVCKRDKLLRVATWLAVILVLMNLLLSATVTLAGEESVLFNPDYVPESAGLNMLAALGVILPALRFRRTLFATKGLYLLIFLVFALSVAVNVETNRRVLGCFAFLVLLWCALERPFFLSALFERLLRLAPFIALVYGLYVLVLNWPAVRLDFGYAKSVDERVQFPFRNPNMLCQVLDVLVVLVAARFIYARSTAEKLLCLGPLVLLTNLILGTVSRGGILQLLAVLGLIAISSVYRAAPRRLVGFAVTGGILAALLLIGLNIAGIDVRGQLESRFSAGDDQGMYFSRGVTVEALAQLAGEPRHLWLGKGAGSGAFVERFAHFAGISATFSAHNSYVDVIAQFGLPMLLTFLGLLASVLARCWKLVAGTRESFLWLLLLICGIHPLFEDYYFFRFGVACDVIRVSLLAHLVDLAWTRHQAKRAALRLQAQAAADAAYELGLVPGGSPAR